ncbi:hypothetical protein GCM10022245_17950 [Streptomyces mayteni]
MEAWKDAGAVRPDTGVRWAGHELIGELVEDPSTGRVGRVHDVECLVAGRVWGVAASRAFGDRRAVVDEPVRPAWIQPAVRIAEFTVEAADDGLGGDRLDQRPAPADAVREPVEGGRVRLVNRFDEHRRGAAVLVLVTLPTPQRLVPRPAPATAAARPPPAPTG